MTAEIAIMNTEAIALAADSAVTIDTGFGGKIYNTVNKLFALSKSVPVGVMIYGRADIMGVPWESIIKAHRAKIGSKRFGTVKEYASHFTTFVSTIDRLFPTDIQTQYFRETAISAFHAIRRDFEGQIKKVIADKGKVTPNEIQYALDKAVEDFSQFLAAKKLLRGVKASQVDIFGKRYLKLVKEAVAHVFQKLPLSGAAIRKLARIPPELFCRRAFNQNDSGVVVAGFGENQIFPSLEHLVFGGITDGVLRYDILANARIAHDNRAVIQPFAQSEMVQAFMEGIDPKCQEVIDSYWNTIVTQFPADVIKAMPRLKGKTQQDAIKKLEDAGRRILVEFGRQLDDYQRKRHIAPIIRAIAVLPKDLLAEVAESLVNLTSFKRRISMDSAETVGGPIDVAVISRGDGFVWIKRKHYFKPELNPQFMAQYFGGRHEAKGKKS